MTSSRLGVEEEEVRKVCPLIASRSIMQRNIPRQIKPEAIVQRSPGGK